jgi:hypothetical protein
MPTHDPIHRFAKAESKTYAEELKGKLFLWIRNNRIIDSFTRTISGSSSCL